MQPRHPGQLYEAIAYLILFFIMIYLYKNYSKKLHRGFFFGLCLTYIFTFRFFIEFLKENQEAFEDQMMFNMGQWLSKRCIRDRHWKCRLQAGENTVIARSKGKEEVADTLRFVYETRTWGIPARLQTKVTSCGTDLSLVEVQIVDAQGVPCLNAKNFIEFGLTGDGKLIENQGTSIGSRKVQAYNGRAAIRVNKRNGESIVSCLLYTSLDE